MMRKMSLEQMDHVLRHVEMHANEFRHGNFTKGGDYLKKLKEAQELALEVSHDIIHVMRTKQFKGYENADFSTDTKTMTLTHMYLCQRITSRIITMNSEDLTMILSRKQSKLNTF